MLSMLLELWLKRILPMVSQSLDLLRETLIGLCTILTLRDGSSAGHSQQLALWCHSGFISLISTTLSLLKDLTTKIILDLKTRRPVRCGRDASGLSPTKFYVHHPDDPKLNVKCSYNNKNPYAPDRYYKGWGQMMDMRLM